MLSASFDGGAELAGQRRTAAPAVMGTALETLAAGGFGAVRYEVVARGRAAQRRDVAGGAERRRARRRRQPGGARRGADPVRRRGAARRAALPALAAAAWPARNGMGELAAMSAGEPFTLIERETLAAIERRQRGAEARLLASGVGDPPEGGGGLPDRRRRKPAASGPVHLRAEETAGGDLSLSWVRRSRQGWALADGADTPLGEETERYRLTSGRSGFERRVETTAPGLSLHRRRARRGRAGAAHAERRPDGKPRGVPAGHPQPRLISGDSS